jgi:hypothetical protein
LNRVEAVSLPVSAQVKVNHKEPLEYLVTSASLSIRSSVLASVNLTINPPLIGEIKWSSSPLLKIQKESAHLSYSGSAHLKVISKQSTEVTISSSILKVGVFLRHFKGSSVVLKVSGSSKKNYLVMASEFLKVLNLAPDYLSTLKDCSTYVGSIPKLEIPVKVGEFTRIVSFEEEIEKIYNKPFSVAFAGNEVYGRLIKEKPVTMRVFFKSGKVMDITLVPYKSELIKFIFGD